MALTPKVFETLVFLVTRAGHVVSKDELIKALWPRGYVDESNLTKHIWLIRRALGHGDQDSGIIETVPKLGYRFIATVTVESAPRAPSPPTATPESIRPARAGRSWMWGVALMAAAAALVIGWRLMLSRPDVASAAKRGVLVAFVGFSNLSRNPKDAWL
ncbi:MAG: winged helix-turn-helix domain-containing protein, partial [Proteobacteria bacterium]|nr:winged helix-turn-helix domain-containing protein [Pseudomonadota bacterium]